MKTSPHNELLGRVTELLSARTDHLNAVAQINSELSDVLGINVSQDFRTITTVSPGAVNQTAPKNQRKCGKCGKPGHIARHCGILVQTEPDDDKSDLDRVREYREEHPDSNSVEIARTLKISLRRVNELLPEI